MSDVKDREPLDAGSDLDIETSGVEPVRARSLTERALAPLRRLEPLRRSVWGERTPRGPAEITIKPGDSFDFSSEPKSQTRLILITLIVVVALPIFASGVYLFFIASDQYSAEARFAVKTTSVTDGGSDESKSGGSSLSNVVINGGSLGGQEAEIVANYIHSRAIVDDVSRTLDVRAIFQRPEADFVARLSKDASAEDLTDYWKKMVSVYIESSSGIVTVEARAFRREDALKLTQAIVKSSETLVNSMSNNVRADAVKHAEDEIRRSDAEVRFALANLTIFRNAQGLINPVKSSEETGKLLLQLMGDKVEAEGQVFVTERTAGPNAPGLSVTKARLASIDSHIATLQQQLAGDKTKQDNMAAAISKFEELELKRQFAERMYGFARDGMDRARLIAERRAVYLEVFVPPSLPEDYSYPLRFSDFALIALAAIVAWSCGATIYASVLDHRL